MNNASMNISVIQIHLGHLLSLLSVRIDCRLHHSRNQDRSNLSNHATSKSQYLLLCTFACFVVCLLQTNRCLGPQRHDVTLVIHSENSNNENDNDNDSDNNNDNGNDNMIMIMIMMMMLMMMMMMMMIMMITIITILIFIRKCVQFIMKMNAHRFSSVIIAW